MVFLFYTTLISVDLAQCKIFRAQVNVFLQGWFNNYFYIEVLKICFFSALSLESIPTRGPYGDIYVCVNIKSTISKNILSQPQC